MAATAPIFAEISLDRLRFDPDNPRFANSIIGADQASVLNFMLEDAGLIDLMRSIADQGFFPGEPILVCPDHEDPDSRVVVEGNRRLAACLLLNNPDLAPTRRRSVRQVATLSTPPTAIPCLQFTERNEILQHLGYRHVTGIKEWEPLAKARFLQQRYDNLTGSKLERSRVLARSIGSRSDYVLRLLTAYAIYQTAVTRNFFGIVGLSESAVDFSLISSVLAYEKIISFLGLSSAADVDVSEVSEENLADILRWLFVEEPLSRRTVLGESRNIRKLADVVASEDAVEALRNGSSLDAAVRVSRSGVDAFLEALYAAKNDLLTAREQVRVRETRRADVQLAMEVRDLAGDLFQLASARLTEVR